MHDGELLRLAVLANPDDDTARLVYADWLDEQGEHARAETIREQIKFHRGGGYTLGACVRNSEEARWFPFSRRDVGREWSRGFVSAVSLPCAAFMAHAEELFRSHPVTSVRLTGAEAWEDDQNTPVTWRWQSDRLGGDEDVRIGGLPMPLMRLVRRHPDHAELDKDVSRLTSCVIKSFPTRALADLALSAACVSWARRLAGLPAWEPAAGKKGATV